MTIHNETGRKEITCLQSPVAPGCRVQLLPAAEKLAFREGAAGPGGTGASMCALGPAPGLVAVSETLGQWLGRVPAWGGQMEIALELFIYLYASMFQEGFKEA